MNKNEKVKVKDSDGIKLIAQNRRAKFDYFLDKFHEAGIQLRGTEVKSLRNGKASLAEAWVKIDSSGEVWLMQAHIQEYTFGNRANHDPVRARKLLLHRNEILKLQAATRERSTSLIPTKLYFRHGLAKIEFAVGVGKNTHDKRQTLKTQQANREMARALKTR
jgi:SsrA-binding protein